MAQHRPDDLLFIVQVGLYFILLGSFSDRDPTTTKADEMVSEADIIDWLSNKEVISTIMSCTEDAMDALKRYSSKGIFYIC